MLRREPEKARATRRCVDAICELAGWIRRDLAERLGVGETVLHYYAHDTALRWLSLALIGLMVSELGLPLADARQLIGDMSAGVTRPGSRAP